MIRNIVKCTAMLGAVFFCAAQFCYALNISYTRDTRHQWNKRQGPLVPHKTFPKKCDLCHVSKRWDVLRADFHFDHLKETQYPLEGAHAKIACLLCHNDRAAPKGLVSRSCSACHIDPHKSTLGLDCKKCHNEINWKPMQTAIAQHVQTRFPLTGFHATVLCVQCHSRANTGDYQGAPVDCYSCHQSDFNKAPNHVAMNFSHACQNCHTTTNFTGAIFDHSSLGPNPDCYQCHKTDYEQAQNPNHVTLGLPTTCAQCHNTSTWFGAVFNHAAVGFPLAGKHASAQCSDCHVNNNYTLKDANCVPCHQTDYANTSPSHTAMGWPSDTPTCTICHGDINAWSNGPTNAAPSHSTFAGGWPLGGLHNDSGKTQVYGTVVASCDGCHTNGNAYLSGTSCAPCHQADFNAASQPGQVMVHGQSPYVASGCANCHGDFTSWTNGTGHTHTLPLTGAHNTACANCHVNGKSFSDWTCTQCHQTDYNATSPSHASMGWPSDTPTCTTCHGDLTAWSNAPSRAASSHGSFAGGWGLSGLHNDSGKTQLYGPVIATCDGCHANSNSYISGNNCVPCHQGDYTYASSAQAQPVQHDAQSYPSSACGSCHGDYQSWANGTGHTHIDPLTGMHNTACSNCHNAQLGQTHTDWTCSQCHLSYDTGGGDYVNATTPIDHDMKNGGKYALPTQCDNCHNYAAHWNSTGSLINQHPSGTCSGSPGSSTPWNHENVIACSDCHSTVTSMTVADGTFNCSLCHSGQHRGTSAGTCARGD